MRNYIIVRFTKYSGDRITEDDLGGTCNVDGRDKKCIKNVGWKR